jgi:hypothetical protein
MSKHIKKQNIGSSLDAFPDEDGLLEVCEEQAIKAICRQRLIRAWKAVLLKMIENYFCS